MLSIAGILSRYKRRVERILLIDRIIRSLRISEAQKELYAEALKVLDDKKLDAFYGKLFEFFEIVESGDSLRMAEERKNTLLSALSSEAGDRHAERSKDFDEFWFVFDR